MLIADENVAALFRIRAFKYLYGFENLQIKL